MTQNLLDIRLQGIKDAASRARFAFLTITLASLTLITAAWNAYGSWYRNFLRLSDFATNEVTRRAQQEVVTQWVRSQWISLGPLGLQAGVSDASVLASFGIAVIALWLFFAVRRENHEIARLLSDASLENDIELRQKVLHGITANLVFIGISGDDTPYRSLAQRPSASEAKGMRWFLSMLFLLPPVAILGMFLVDVGSIFWIDALLRSEQKPLLGALREAPISTVITAVAMLLICLALGVFTWIVCRRVADFEKATTDVMREFTVELEELEKADPKIREIPRMAAPPAPTAASPTLTDALAALRQLGRRLFQDKS